MDNLPLYKRLQRRYCQCPLSNEKFLPLNAIDEEITEENVKAKLQVGRLSQLPRNVVQRAKRIFAILEIIGEPQAIKDLIAQGITDGDLPLSRKDGDLDSSILVANDD